MAEADSFTPIIGQPNERRRRILLVDNNRDFTLGARRMLQRTGRYLFFEENEASNALETARKFKPEIILLDIAMPQADGPEVAREIEADRGLCRIPIVFLTGLVTRG